MDLTGVDSQHDSLLNHGIVWSKTFFIEMHHCEMHWMKEFLYRNHRMFISDD
ncbi:MAG: hypothetical protein ACFFAK_00160 [Promethearchaeota archaeon]